VTFSPDQLGGAGRAPALLIVDMQYATASRSGALARLLRRTNREADGEYRFNRLEQLVLPNQVRLLAGFRLGGLPRIFVSLGGFSSTCREVAPRLRTLERELANYLGSREYDLLPELSRQQDELLIGKVSASAFTSSGLDAALRNMAITHLYVAGVSTSECVDLTARDAADRGYDTAIVADAVAEDRPEYHDATLLTFAAFFGRVVTADEVLTELSGRLTPIGRSTPISPVATPPERDGMPSRARRAETPRG